MDYPDKALLDADFFAINIARLCDQEGIEEIPAYTDHAVRKWTPAGTEEVALAFSAPRKTYYRKDVYPSYKSNRDGMEKPRCLGRVKDYCEENYNCMTVDKLEADDLLGIYCSSGDVIGVSIDKDMRSTPGWHWNPTKELEPVLVDKESADLWFHSQWIAGDPVDGFKGIWRMGHKKSLKYLESTDPQNHTAAVMALYEQKGYDYEYCKAMAVCARILRVGEMSKNYEAVIYDPHTEVHHGPKDG